MASVRVCRSQSSQAHDLASTRWSMWLPAFYILHAQEGRPFQRVPRQEKCRKRIDCKQSLIECIRPYPSISIHIHPYQSFTLSLNILYPRWCYQDRGVDSTSPGEYVLCCGKEASYPSGERPPRPLWCCWDYSRFRWSWWDCRNTWRTKYVQFIRFIIHHNTPCCFTILI